MKCDLRQRRRTAWHQVRTACVSGRVRHQLKSGGVGSRICGTILTVLWHTSLPFVAMELGSTATNALLSIGSITNMAHLEFRPMRHGAVTTRATLSANQ